MSKSTQFKATPAGVKTPRMLVAEKKIGATLEEDYLNNYLTGKLGQKRLASRWGVGRNLIFGGGRGKRRNWVQMLNLPLRGEKPTQVTAPRSSSCEICGISDLPLEGAHWVPAREGGSSKSYNILKLCPNCHTLLDNVENEKIVLRSRQVLLTRAAEQLLNSTSVRDEEFQKSFVDICKSIIERKNL